MTDIDWILDHPGLSDRDKLIAIKIDRTQAKGEFIKTDSLMAICRRSRSSVNRSLRSLREKNVLLTRRRGPQACEYLFSRTLPAVSPVTHLRLVTPQPDDTSKEESYMCQLDDPSKHTKYSYLTSEEYKNRSILNRKLSLSSSRLFVCSLRSSNALSILRANFCDDVSETKKIPEASVEKSETSLSMPKVVGPDGPLKDIANFILSRPQTMKKSRPQLKPKKPKMTQEQRMMQKQVSEYNCNDMWYIYRDAWVEKWKSRPAVWINRERKHVKQLIQEQGPEAVLTLLEYVIENWENLVSRYRLTGAPSISCIYGYRRSWVPEALGDVSTKPGWQKGSEYSGPVEDDNSKWEEQLKGLKLLNCSNS